MELIINTGNPLRGQASLPGDKSISHRAALFAALAHGESRFSNFLDSGVTRAMLNALSDLGIEWELAGTNLRVKGAGLAAWRTPDRPVNCGNSGTTMRLLAGALAATNTQAVLDGSAGLRRRPMDRVIDPLRHMGALIQAAPGGKAPLSFKDREQAGKLRGIDYAMPVASAQVKSALLLAALGAETSTTICEPYASRDHGEIMLRAMGVNIIRGDAAGGITLYPSPTPLKPLEMAIPGDISSAAFLIVAALITPGSEIVIKNVGLNPTRTGLLDVLSRMGGDIEILPGMAQYNESIGDIKVRHSKLHAVEVGGETVVRMIDEFPVFAAAAANAEGISIVRGAEELRYKETDRIRLLVSALHDFGIPVEEYPDGFKITGGEKYAGGRAAAGGDHRLGMALAVLGLGSSTATRVQGAQIIGESFPAFVPTLQALGADVSMHEG